MTITQPLAALAAVFLSRYVRHLPLRGVFRIHVILPPFRRYPRHAHNPRQTHPLQQPPIDHGFGFRTDRLPFRIFHVLPPTTLTRELRWPGVAVTVRVDLARPAAWAAWHSFGLAYPRPAIVQHYLYPTAHVCHSAGCSPYSSDKIC